MAFDPDLLGDRDEFIGNVTTLIQNVKATKKLPGVTEILVPGERGNRQTNQAMESGMIDIEENLYEELKRSAG